jgi:pyochelin biosynthetic protein PchC
MNETDAPPRWWASLRRASRARSRLLLFPHSAGGPYALLPLVSAVHEDVEILGLTLPGREHRFAEPPGTTLEAVADSVAREIVPLPPLPTVLFGCSMGALLAARIAERFPDLCTRLVVAGQSPGDGHRWVFDAVDEPDLLRVLDATGGVPAWMLEDAETRAELLARLGADLRLGAEAARGFGRVRVHAPITAIGGTRDPLVPPGCLDGWAGHGARGIRVLRLEGEHFAFLAARHRGQVADLLAAARNPAPAAGAPR